MTDVHDLQERITAALSLALEQAGHDCQYGNDAQVGEGPDGDGTVVICGCGFYAPLPAGYLTNQLGETAQGNALAMPDQPTVHSEAERIVTPTLELVDPSAILTPDDLSAHILDVVNRLERGALFAMQCISAEFEARRAFKMGMAKHVAASKASSADRRDAEAMVACEALYNEMVMAEMMARVARESLHNLRSILSGYQTTGRAVMAVYGAGGSPSGHG